MVVKNFFVIVPNLDKRKEFALAFDKNILAVNVIIVNSENIYGNLWKERGEK